MISPALKGSSTVRRVAFLAAVAGAGALVLSACSGSASGSSTSSSSAPTSAGGAGQGGPAGQGGGTGQGGPAASGTVAAISGTTMQVQNQQSGQVAVSWSASTKFTQPVAASLSSVKAGDCVTAVAPSGTASTATSFTATTLQVSSAVNGQCTGGPGGGRGGGQRPSGFPSGQRPSGFPGGASGRPGIGALASGKVTSVSGSTVVVAARQFGSNGSTTNKNVTVGSTTKITTEASTTSTSLKVGKCVVAQGKADSTGTVAATSVRISDPVNGQCGIGFGGRGNGA